MEAWDLVHEAQQGSQDAFGELYSRYYDGVYHYVLARTGRPALAEDLSSETFLRALRRIDSVRNTGKELNSWLITIARNVVIDYFKVRPQPARGPHRGMGTRHGLGGQCGAGSNCASTGRCS